jgi:hypothetical protein
MNIKLTSAYIVFMGAFALYVGISGWVLADFEARMERQVRENKGDTSVIFEGVSFANAASARQAAEEDKISRYFRWVFMVPPGLPLFLTSLAFGVVGGIANIAHKLAGSLFVPTKMLVFKPLFGGVVGLMIFGLATAAPKLVVESADGVRPIAVMFLCLLGGTFSNHVYAWVEEKTKALFPLTAPTSGAAPGPPASRPPSPPAAPPPPSAAALVSTPLPFTVRFSPPTP